jgi:conjugative transfer signal peptidase TraF
MRFTPRDRAPFVAVAALASFAVGIPSIAQHPPLLIYNGSASAPLGFYRLVSGDPITQGDFVLARLPKPAAQLAANRHYLPRSIPVVKRVAALDGDRVCASSGVVRINDRVVAHALPADRAGRPLPAWQGCRALAPGEVFLLMPDAPASFDGRYFGPIPTTAIIGRLVPLWTW